MFDFFNLPYHVLGEIITCILSLVILWNILSSFSPYDVRHRLFLYSAISTFLAAFVNILSVFCIGHYQAIPISTCTFISTLYFIFLMFTPFALCCYVMMIALSFSKHQNLAQILNGIVYAVYLGIILLNLKTGWVFHYDSVEGYVRGPLKIITYVTTTIYSLLEVSVAIFNKKSIAKRLFVVFITYPILSLLILLIQLHYPTVIMTGISSFAALMLAYISIQTDMLEFDFVTGLMTNRKLFKQLELKNKEGVLYILSIENMNIIQNNMENSEMNQLLLSIGKEFSLNFQRDAYHISTSRYAGIAQSLEDVKAADEKIRTYIHDLRILSDSKLPLHLDAYYVSVGFSKGEKISNNIMEVVNDMLRKCVIKQDHDLQICNDGVLFALERKRKINEILRRELRLDSEKFQVYFQPIFSVKEKKFTYMEALSRLIGTEIGDIPPQEFVEVAESRGLIERLGFVAFEKVCKFIADNKDTVQAVSINFSVYQMSNPDIVQNVISTIERFNLPPKSIIMEITESLFIDNYELVSIHMRKLAEYGVQFYLDDFGTGYSNLSNVISLPFTTIKLDRTLVLMMEEDKNKERFFMNIVATLKDAGMNILVEGVETQSQNALVEQAGADYIQGFLYSRPLPAEKCIELLKKQ